MKNYISLLILLLSFSLKGEPLSFYRQFFDKKIDITHDPDFPLMVTSGLKSDLYDVLMTDTDKAVGLALMFSLTPDGKFRLYQMLVRHKWEGSRRSIRLEKCQAYNGQWEHKEGSLFIGNLMKLDPYFRNQRNLLSVTFLALSIPTEVEGLHLTLSNDFANGLDFSPGNDDFKCIPFSIPIWLPIPSTRPWD